MLIRASEFSVILLPPGEVEHQHSNSESVMPAYWVLSLSLYSLPRVINVKVKIASQISFSDL